MANYDSLIPILGLIAVIFISFRIKILSDSQRYALYKFGKFVKFIGPGLVIQHEKTVLKWMKVSIGNTGELVAPDMVRIFEKKERYFDLPVMDMGSARIGAIVRVTGFTVDKLRCTMNPDQRRTIRCEKCGHEMALN